MTNAKIVRLVTLWTLIVLLVAAIPVQAFAAEREEDFEMPLYNQYDYPDVPYGKQSKDFLEGKEGADIKSVAERGCGITSLAMVAAYLYQDESMTPDYLAIVYGNPDKPVQGVNYGSLADIMVSVGTECLELNMDLTFTFSEVVEALKEGKVVISLQNEGLFTAVPNGHFVVFRGITENGDILVNDPNGKTYGRYPSWFANGFPQSELRGTGSGYWIVTVKEETDSNIS